MKIRTLKLLVKEGAQNVFKNKLMSFASTMTVVTALFFLGIILLTAINISSNVEAMKRDLKIRVYLKTDVTPFQREEVITFIEGKKTAGVISEYLILTKEQIYKEFKEIMDDQAQSLLKGYTVENVPEAFEIKLTDPNSSEDIIKNLSSFKGIYEDGGIGYDKEVLDKLEAMLNVFNYIIMVILAVLMVISVFLISNTIRLTVFARRHQIEIMKYVGALDSFIRWPFIVEGLLIGFIGAVLALLMTSQAYKWLQNLIIVLLPHLGSNSLRVLEFGPVAIRFLAIYTIFGVIIGGVGSFVSVRKHLNV